MDAREIEKEIRQRINENEDLLILTPRSHQSDYRYREGIIVGLKLALGAVKGERNGK